VEHPDRRRKFNRYRTRWKVAVVFDQTDGRPTLHTETRDLSAGGAAIVSTYGDLTGSLVTLLMARPTRPGVEPPKLIKLKAQVVSSIHVPSMPGYRHGLRFIPSPGDGLSLLAGVISAAESAQRSAAQTDARPTSAPAQISTRNPAPAARSTPDPVPPAAAADSEMFNASPGSLLARLREAALAKKREERKPEQKERFIPLVSGAVEKTYRHLKEVVTLLNTVKPAYARAYTFHGLPNFDGLKWMSVHLDFRARELSPTSKAFEQVTLHYRLAAGKVLSMVREIPADDKLKRMLEEAKVEFSTQQERNNRGSLAGTKFVVPCEVNAVLQLIGDFETGQLVLKLRNVQDFGTAEYVLSAEAFTTESLDELLQFILGETKQIGSLLQKGV
jgi:hypothetical protein